MPIPKPTPTEKTSKDGESKFIGRCMSLLKDEFPDQKQRAAVCYQTYQESKKKSSGKFDTFNEKSKNIEIVE